MKIISTNLGQEIMVDDADYEWLNQYKWQVSNNGYAFRNHGGKLRLKQSMHRMILGLTDPKVYTDHKDRNRLNNCRSNLRPATAKQNGCNKTKRKGLTSKYRGVSWFKRDSKWIVHIKVNGKNRHLGVFFDELQAAMKYDEVAKELYGEFATLNIQ